MTTRATNLVVFTRQGDADIFVPADFWRRSILTITALVFQLLANKCYYYVTWRCIRPNNLGCIYSLG
uniref:Uncharacterized protein n=1 Tax=Arundo donax TaxID=35708 RepID=A0A0A8Z6H3_ARUDO